MKADTPPGATYTELPMFEFPEVLARQAKTPAQIARDLKPAWRAYTGATRKPCGVCLRELHAADGHGPLPNTSRHVRTVKATGDELYLCEAHAKPLKTADERAGRRRR